MKVRHLTFYKPESSHCTLKLFPVYIYIVGEVYDFKAQGYISFNYITF